MKKSTNSRYHVPNLIRGMAILELLSKHPEGLGMVEIARAMEMPNNSVFRIATTLTELGYLQRDESSKRFSLTRKLLALGCQSVAEHSLVEESIEHMRQLRDKVKETVLLATVLNTQVIVIEQVTGIFPFRFVVDIGKQAPLHASAPGKAILAFLPENELDDLIKIMPFERYNDQTITSRQDFRQELTKIRQRGYAFDLAEEMHGVRCTAAPIFNHVGYPVAAITVTGPADRLPDDVLEHAGQMVKEHSMEISRQMGFVF